MGEWIMTRLLSVRFLWTYKMPEYQTLYVKSMWYEVDTHLSWILKLYFSQKYLLKINVKNYVKPHYLDQIPKQRWRPQWLSPYNYVKWIRDYVVVYMKLLLSTWNCSPVIVCRDEAGPNGEECCTDTAGLWPRHSPLWIWHSWTWNGLQPWRLSW